MADKNDAAAKARADRREAERQARLSTGKPAASVRPAIFRAIARNSKNN